jgi:UPF0755 protein
MILLVVVCIALIAFGYYFKQFTHRPLASDNNQILYVPPGSSIQSVAGNLQKRGILSHPQWFILLAQIKGQIKNLKAGEYRLEKGLTPIDLLQKLVTGKVMLRQLTIIEGWTAKQVFSSVNNNKYLAHTIANLAPDECARKLGARQPNLEGYLYPDTYFFAAGVPDTVILKTAFLSMQKRLSTLWQKRDPHLPFQDAYAALIVASLIEKETGRPEERAKIAGVITRRLEKGMPLQIDAAIIYGLGEHYSGKITREDLQKDTPYNTYLHKGLPPTPIAMPSLAAMQAALHPEAGNALYYVARGDGTHEFSATLRQHHEAISKFRRGDIWIPTWMTCFHNLLIEDLGSNNGHNKQ